MNRLYQRYEVHGIIYACDREYLYTDKHRPDSTASNPASISPPANPLRVRFCAELISLYRASTCQSIENVKRREITPVFREGI